MSTPRLRTLQNKLSAQWTRDADAQIDAGGRITVGASRPATRGWLRSTDSLAPWADSLKMVVLGILAAVIVPLVLQGQLFNATTAVIYATFALSVNLVFGWSGLPSFGGAAFFGIGAYAVALLGEKGVVGPLPVLIGALIAGVVALLTSVVVLRSSGLAFAMFTLAFAQILYEIALSSTWAGQDTGIVSYARGSVGPWSVQGNTAFWAYTVAWCVLLTIIMRLVWRSSLGASMRAVRQDPTRAAALGIPVRRVRVVAYVISGALGSATGGLFVQLNGVADPTDDLFWTLSGTVLLMILVGGIRSFWGPFIGAAVYVGVDAGLLGSASPDIYLGLLFVLIVLLFPRGLIGLAQTAGRLTRGRSEMLT
jgi:branched-chain amino acid transport system permease protein